MEHPYRPVPASPDAPFRIRASIARSSRKIAVLAGLALSITAGTFVAKADASPSWADRVAEENAVADLRSTMRGRRAVEAAARAMCTPSMPCATLATPALTSHACGTALHSRPSIGERAAAGLYEN